MPLVPQKIIFPQNGYGRYNGIIGRVRGACQQMEARLRIGYIPALERAGSEIEIAGMTSKIQRILSRGGIALGQEQARAAVERAIVLNSNMTISNGQFHFHGRNEGGEVSLSILRPDLPGFFMERDDSPLFQYTIEQKRLFLETFVKAVIGEIPASEKPVFNRVGEILNIPELFADGQGFNGKEILTSLEERRGFELGDRQGSRWSSTLSDIEQGKRLTMERENISEANQKYFRGVLGRFLKKSEAPNLDAGCGWGDLFGQLPEALRPTVVNLDWNSGLLEALRKKYPQAQVKQGNVYKMPFPAENFGNVFSLTSFGSLWFLEQAIGEVARILKPGGRFFAFQDMNPNEIYQAEQLLRRGLICYGNTVFSFQRVCDPAFLNRLTEGIGYRTELPDLDDWDDYQRIFNELMVMQNCHEYLEARLINELKYAGLRILYAGPETVFNVAQGGLYGHVYQFGSGGPEKLGVVTPDAFDLPYFSLGQNRGPLKQLPQIMFMGENAFEEIRQAIGRGKFLQQTTIWAVIAEK